MQLLQTASSARRRSFEKSSQTRSLKKRKNADLTEVERLKAELVEKDKVSAELTSKTATRVLRTEAKVAALGNGVKPERVEAVLRLTDLSAVERTDGEPDAAAISAAIEATLKEYPEFRAVAGSADAGAKGNPAIKTTADLEKMSMSRARRVSQEQSTLRI